MANMSRKQNDVQLSKQLSWLLRHGAQKEGITMQPDGFVSVPEILKHPRFGNSYTLEKLQDIVAADAKQRYTLRLNPITGIQEIRANQGHSLASVEADACLQRIHSIADLPETVVHGTFYKNWESIKTEGLKRMRRNHVHFAVLSDDGNVGLSGFRSDCQVLIYLNVAKVLKDKLQLFRSSNNVILCSGVDGCIKSAYFGQAIDRRTGKALTY